MKPESQRTTPLPPATWHQVFEEDNSLWGPKLALKSPFENASEVKPSRSTSDPPTPSNTPVPKPPFSQGRRKDHRSHKFLTQAGLSEGGLNKLGIPPSTLRSGKSTEPSQPPLQGPTTGTTSTQPPHVGQSVLPLSPSPGVDGPCGVTTPQPPLRSHKQRGTAQMNHHEHRTSEPHVRFEEADASDVQQQLAHPQRAHVLPLGQHMPSPAPQVQHPSHDFKPPLSHQPYETQTATQLHGMVGGVMVRKGESHACDIIRTF